MVLGPGAQKSRLIHFNFKQIIIAINKFAAVELSFLPLIQPYMIFLKAIFTFDNRFEVQPEGQCGLKL